MSITRSRVPLGVPSGVPLGQTYGTPTVRPAGSPGVPCSVQNQNQNQTVLTVVCGVSNYSIHPSLQAVEGHRSDAWMGANAQIRRWFK